MREASLQLLSPDSERSRSKRRNTSTTTGASNVSTSPDHRWSEVVPSQAALTFAVVWDPEDGIIGFSGAHLLDDSPPELRIPDSPSEACDNRSQVLTIGQSTIPLSENTSTLAFFRDTHQFLFPRKAPTIDRHLKGHTQTSSTMNGVDVYLRGSMLDLAHLDHPHFSCLNTLDVGFDFDPQIMFAGEWLREFWLREAREKDNESKDSISDEGFFEDRQPHRPSEDGAVLVELNLSSAFSVTTTSTSSYVSVEREDSLTASAWSTLEAPNTPGFSRQTFPTRSRRLTKRPPIRPPAPPSEVLSRTGYNHDPARPSLERSNSGHSTIPKFVRDLGRWKKCSWHDNEQWVCIDVVQEITQRYV